MHTHTSLKLQLYNVAIEPDQDCKSTEEPAVTVEDFSVFFTHEYIASLQYSEKIIQCHGKHFLLPSLLLDITEYHF